MKGANLMRSNLPESDPTRKKVFREYSDKWMLLVFPAVTLTLVVGVAALICLAQFLGA
jgi:hypothetical protein